MVGTDKKRNRNKRKSSRKINVGSVGNVNTAVLEEAYDKSQDAVVGLVQGMLDRNKNNK